MQVLEQLYNDPNMATFSEWINEHGRVYETDDEFLQRFAIFKKNAEQIRQFQHQLNLQEGLIQDDSPKHKVGLNHFADWTDEEYKAILGFKPDVTKKQENLKVLEADPLPETINWVDQGKVTPVKDQGTCGSCWSFSTTGSMESAYWIKNGQEIELSEQQLVDCSISFGNNGCSGGLVEYAYNYAKHHGIETEEEYPYHAKNQKCAAQDKKNDLQAVELTDFVDVPRHDPEQLA